MLDRLVQLVIQERLVVELLLVIPEMPAELVLMALPVIQALLVLVQQQETREMLVVTARQVMLERQALMELVLQQVQLETPARQVMQAAQPLRQPLRIPPQISRIVRH